MGPTSDGRYRPAAESGTHMISRRDILKSGAAALGGIVLPGAIDAPLLRAAQGPAADGGRRNLRLTNGRFMDGRGYVTSALTIRDGRIVTVGPDPRPSDDAFVVDLGGRTAVPGLFDSHVHYVRAGVNPGYETRGIERAFSIRELQETLA